MLRRFLPFVCLTASISCGQSEFPGLTVRSQIVKEEYCQQRDGRKLLWLTLGFTYENHGTRPLILPIFSRLSAVRISTDRATIVQGRYKWKAGAGISQEIYATSMPSLKMFYIVQPGKSQQSVEHLHAFVIASSGSRAKRGIVRPGKYDMRIDVNLGLRLHH